MVELEDGALTRDYIGGYTDYQMAKIMLVLSADLIVHLLRGHQDR